MVYNSKIHCRRSIRLKDYDYGQSGAYFVTICTQGRQCLFGEIADGQMVVNGAGTMVAKWWHELENKYPNIALDCFVVMPNHFHGIIAMGNHVGADLCVCPGKKISGEHAGSPLPAMVQWFKTMTTNDYIRHVKQEHWRPFNGRLWQRNYYEHVIRNDDDLSDIREYSINNALRWADDPERIR